MNLTIPAAHAEVSLRALQAGKHIYSKKPFATNRADAQSKLDLAQDKNFMIGSAPDTFLGGRWKTVRRMMDGGVIGDVTACMVFVSTHGVELHRPNRDFYYQEGCGPLIAWDLTF